MSSLPDRLDELPPPALPGRSKLAGSDAVRGRSLLDGGLVRPLPVKPDRQPSKKREERESMDGGSEDGVFAMDVDDPVAPSRAVSVGDAKAAASAIAASAIAATLPARAQSSGAGGSGSGSAAGSRRASGSGDLLGGGPAEKKPRRTHGGSSVSASAPVTPLLGPLGVSPPSVSALVPLEADLQPHAMLRSHEFTSGRRVFHVHFGHGFVRSLDTDTGATPPLGPASDKQPAPASQRSQNMNMQFDNPKYKQLRLRAFYAVPKMVVIPSSSALRKQRLQLAVEATPADPAPRIALVRSLLATNSTREACALIHKWQLQSPAGPFEPAALLQRLLQQKQFNAAVRFAREFSLADEHPPLSLLRRMVEGKRYEGALKHVDPKSESVDGQASPSDVLQMLVGAGHHAVALKYVHKFGAAKRFPPSTLVGACLLGEGELTVRTAALLLKYVKVFALEESYPIECILQRAADSGITVHEMDQGRYVCKGRRRKANQVGGRPV